ncbi:hypothetical protein EV426DRAFT_688018 [Tirmania nivea]|nr:hypothetical protein EV426DRAFT_688018 [Tirmania nivea]
MGDDNPDQTNKKRKPTTNSSISYSKMTIAQAEERLNIRLDEVPGMSVGEMLEIAKDSVKKEDVDAMKEKIYERLLDHIEAEGYPTEANVEFKEPNVSDLVYSIVAPTVADFRRKTGRKLRLTREKRIVSTDNTVLGEEEFVVMDRVSVTEQKFVCIVEGKGSSTGEGVKQCLLAMKDAWDNNAMKESFLYGFVTTGEDWMLYRYDGTSFVVTEKLRVLFKTMDKDKRRWIDNYSVVVDCLYSVLSDGGIAGRDVVVG